MGSELGLLVRPLEEPLGELLGGSTKAPRGVAGGSQGTFSRAGGT